MSEMINRLTPLGVALTIVLCITVVVLLRSNLSVMWKAILVPTALALGLSTPYVFVHSLGYSLPVASLSEGIYVIAHRTVIRNNKKVRIELWIIEGRETRLMSIPYAKPLERALEGAVAGRSKGLIAKLKRNKDGSPDIEMQRPDENMPPKDGVPQQGPEEPEDTPNIVRPPLPGTHNV